MTLFDVTIKGLDEAAASTRRFSAEFFDLRPYWKRLGQQLADDAQQRWPLRSRTGKLRRSLKWAGDRLGRGGLYEPTPDRLSFGIDRPFYGAFHHFNTKRQRARPLIHVNPQEHTEQLTGWLRERAQASGLEVEQ